MASAMQQAPRGGEAPRAQQTAQSKQQEQKKSVKTALHDIPQAAGLAIMAALLVVSLFAGNFRALSAATPKDFLRQGDVQSIVEDRLDAAGNALTVAQRAQLDALSSHGAHQGIALEVGNFPYADVADILDRAGEGPALVVVLDHVTDDGNFGAIVRSAEVVGAAGVIIANKRAAGVTVGSYKTSAGAVMHLPIAQVPNIARALDDLKAAGFWVGGASEHAEGSCWDAPFEGRVALVMGSEGDGISRLVLEKCDFLTKLPQRGMTESLNVAQATTALCFEWLRRNAGELMGEE